MSEQNSHVDVRHESLADAVRADLHSAGWYGRADLDPVVVDGIVADVLDSLAGMDALAASPVDDGCTCGWGGVHAPDNPRCALNAAGTEERP